jgi:hypothetical protein
MTRFLALVLFTLGAVAAGQAQPPEKPDTRSFELTAVEPPKPALKYQLLFHDAADRLNGNAAILYLDAILMMGPDAKENGANAIEAYHAEDLTTFNSLAEKLDMPVVLDELELAGRREICDWDAPFRERGAYTYLPHLEPIAHGLTQLIQVKALRQIEQGKTADALLTLRLGYEMSDKVGRDPTLVSSLVSLRIMSQMNEALARLMSRPESPNLYWALSGIPARQATFRHAMDTERSFVALSMPSLLKLRNGGELSAPEWRQLFRDIWQIIDGGTADADRKPHPDAVESASAETLQLAREEYAQSHQLAAAHVAKVDPIVVLGNYYYQQFVVLFDEQYKLRTLPYHELLPRAKDLTATVDRIREEQPGNPFQVYGFEPTTRRFAFADRQLAALTAVEALRSYAAANGGKLPQRLSDVTETPVPKNPATGKSFEYRIDGEKATLSDTQFEPELRYVVEMRR